MDDDRRDRPGFFEVALSQRAHRSLLSDPVGDELIEEILAAATHAPSAENRQPWVFVVVRDTGRRQRIAALVRELWASGIGEMARERSSQRLHADVDRWATSGLADAPVLIVVCGDTSAAEEFLLPSSIFPAVQNLLLAAQALGLGSLLSTLPIVGGDRLREIVELPASIVPMAVIPIGHPARRLTPPKRISFRAKTFRDRYGQPW
jgi:nitroreductase